MVTISGTNPNYPRRKGFIGKPPVVNNLICWSHHYFENEYTSDDECNSDNEEYESSCDDDEYDKELDRKREEEEKKEKQCKGMTLLTNQEVALQISENLDNDTIQEAMEEAMEEYENSEEFAAIFSSSVLRAELLTIMLENMIYRIHNLS